METRACGIVRGRPKTEKRERLFRRGPGRRRGGGRGGGGGGGEKNITRAN